MSLPTRWRSEAVRLAFLGTAGSALVTGLGGCSDVTVQRNIYRTLEDCAADYDRMRCTQRRDASQQVQFVGPSYRARNGRPAPCKSTDTGGGRGSHDALLGGRPMAIGTETVRRGGFGTSCTSRRVGT